MWTRRKEFVRIVAGGVLQVLPTAVRKRREFMHVCNYEKIATTIKVSVVF